MKRLLMIPNVQALPESISLAKTYSLGFEFNDFFSPAVLDDQQQKRQLMDAYAGYTIPKHRTLHGAFLDVIPCSPDHRIRAVSRLRIEQSLETAKALGAGAVVFHTNYNPQLNTPVYIRSWIDENADFWAGVLEGNPGCAIYLENMFDATPEVIGMLSERLCGFENYGVCLDYAHAALSKVAPEQWAAHLGSFVKHVHINDNDLNSDLHLAWGDGKINRDSFYRSYQQYLDGASVLIEVSTLERCRRSLETLAADGFLD